MTESCKLFHKIITLHEKKFTVSLLHLSLYNLYTCAHLFKHKRTRNKSAEFNLPSPKTIYNRKSGRAVDNVIQFLVDEV